MGWYFATSFSKESFILGYIILAKGVDKKALAERVDTE